MKKIRQIKDESLDVNPRLRLIDDNFKDIPSGAASSSDPAFDPDIGRELCMMTTVNSSPGDSVVSTSGIHFIPLSTVHVLAGSLITPDTANNKMILTNDTATDLYFGLFYGVNNMSRLPAGATQSRAFQFTVVDILQSGGSGITLNYLPVSWYSYFSWYRDAIADASRSETIACSGGSLHGFNAYPAGGNPDSSTILLPLSAGSSAELKLVMYATTVTSGTTIYFSRAGAFLMAWVAYPPSP